MDIDTTEITKTISLRDGREYTVTLKACFWEGLDWMTMDVGEPMYEIVDAAEEILRVDYAGEDVTFDQMLELYIWMFAEAWEKGPNAVKILNS